MSKANSILGKMGVTMPIGKLMGIPMKLHWSIFIFLLYIPFICYYKKIGTADTILLVVLIVLILFSVLLHELGHAYAARNMGIKTHDIVLSLIGGVARLEKIPEDPWQEFKVAFAGPLVNLFIFSLLTLFLMISFWVGVTPITPTLENLMDPRIFINRFDAPLIIVLIYGLALSNLVLFIFNLLPVFPMDGGRIFRAILSKNLGRSRATKIASITGKILAVGLIGAGVFLMRPIWSIIGIFVYLMADIENNQEQQSQRFKSIKADSLLGTSYDRVKLVLPIQEVIKRYFDSDITTYLVEDSQSKIVGVIDENILQSAMREKMEEMPISHYMSQRFALININDNFYSMYDQLVKSDKNVGVVMDYGEVKGVILKGQLESILSSKS